MSYALLNTAMSAAVSALNDGDYAEAITCAVKAQGYLSILPSSKNGTSEMTWNYSGIEQFIANCRKLQSSTTGLGSSGGIFQMQKVQYQRADGGEDC